MLNFEYDVVLCTYNGSKYLEEQLVSILEQKNFPPKKIIISDDGSDDETLYLINNILKKYNFSNFIMTKNPKKGIVSNFFHGISLSESEYIFLSDQDDIWNLSKVEFFSKSFKVLEDKYNNSPLLVFSDAMLVNKYNEEFAPSFFRYQGISEKFLIDDSILYRNCVQGASCAINRNLKELLLESLMIIDESKVYMHDWWIALLVKYYGEYIFLDIPLLRYRQHSLNQIGANKHRTFINYLLHFDKYFINFIKAIRQHKEFIRFLSVYDSKFFECFSTSKRSYRHISFFKKIVVKLIS